MTTSGKRLVSVLQTVRRHLQFAMEQIKHNFTFAHIEYLLVLPEIISEITRAIICSFAGNFRRMASLSWRGGPAMLLLRCFS
ncbi:hypothetical protein KCP74_24320 [Salmonella enterica subsp. enterica]|nr:hypothetical protein KCP74_24320 [Salmonella enterica subsp. enterica]